MMLENVREVMDIKEIQDGLFNHLLDYHAECELGIIYDMGLGELIEIACDYELFGVDEEGRGPNKLVVEGYLVIEDFTLIIPKLLEE